MARNVEIKARVLDLDAVGRAAERVALEPAVRIAQIDTFFVVQGGRLKVRQFADGTGELIAYDRPDVSGPKTSSYERVACADARALGEALGRALPLRGRVVKRRTVFVVGRTRVHLDEVEQLGSFVELEVVLREGESASDGEAEARELMRRFGIGDADLVPDAYIDLLDRAPRDFDDRRPGPCV